MEESFLYSDIVHFCLHVKKKEGSNGTTGIVWFRGFVVLFLDIIGVSISEWYKVLDWFRAIQWAALTAIYIFVISHPFQKY